jgi:hypothetical protein
MNDLNLKSLIYPLGNLQNFWHSLLYISEIIEKYCNGYGEHKKKKLEKCNSDEATIYMRRNIINRLSKFTVE